MISQGNNTVVGKKNISKSNKKLSLPKAGDSLVSNASCNTPCIHVGYDYSHLSICQSIIRLFILQFVVECSYYPAAFSRRKTQVQALPINEKQEALHHLTLTLINQKFILIP